MRSRIYAASIALFTGAVLATAWFTTKPTVGSQDRAPQVTRDEKLDRRRPADEGKLSIPYPGSVNPKEVVENVKSIVEQLQLDKVSGNPDAAMKTSKLEARRILRVKYELVPEDYLLVELFDAGGNPSATMAYGIDGTFLSFRDERGQSFAKSLDLEEAEAKVKEHVRHNIKKKSYVFFPNIAEPGGSILAPLVEVETDGGRVFLNSKGEAFADRQSPLAAELRADPPGAPDLLSRPLHPLGKW